MLDVSAVDILNDLLQYDKIERGELKLQLGVISVWDLVEKVTLEFNLAANSKKIFLGLSFALEENVNDPERSSYQRAADLPNDVRNLCGVGDAGKPYIAQCTAAHCPAGVPTQLEIFPVLRAVRLTQVLRNLMSNALKFTKEEGVIRVTSVFVPSSRSDHGQKTIKLSGEDSISVVYKGQIKISVQDDGVGLSSEQVAKLFKDGTQFNPNENQQGGGTGLGLYIARGIMKQHKGSLSAASEGLGLGATFSMSLPLWDLPDQNERMLPWKTSKEAKTSECSQEEESEVLSSSLYVLVVEDVRSNRKYSVVCWKTGDTLVKKQKTEQLQLILSRKLMKMVNPLTRSCWTTKWQSWM